MEDISPKLLEQLRAHFLETLEKNARAAGLLQQIKAGTAGYAEAGEYAYEVGAALSETFRVGLSSDVLPDGRMYQNIAEKVVAPLLGDDYALVSKAAAQVQQTLNQAAGLGLKAQAAALDTERVQGIIYKVANSPSYGDVAWVLDEPVKTFSQSVVDATLQKNAEFQSKAGLRPRIIRKAETKCCEWCSRMEGVYNYPDVPNDVYRRHERCRCMVEYDPGGGKRQDVWTKQWTSSTEDATIQARKVIGLRVNGIDVREIGDHVIQRMSDRSVDMESIKDALENPLQIKPTRYDDQGRPSFVVVGHKATISINPETGKLTTTYPTHTKTVSKLLQKRSDSR